LRKLVLDLFDSIVLSSSALVASAASASVAAISANAANSVNAAHADRESVELIAGGKVTNELKISCISSHLSHQFVDLCSAFVSACCCFSMKSAVGVVRANSSDVATPFSFVCFSYFLLGYQAWVRTFCGSADQHHLKINAFEVLLSVSSHLLPHRHVLAAPNVSPKHPIFITDDVPHSIQSTIDVINPLVDDKLKQLADAHVLPPQQMPLSIMVLAGTYSTGCTVILLQPLPLRNLIDAALRTFL
jgi:hypothetical protein